MNFNFIKNAKSWNDVFKVIRDLNNIEPKKAGTLFEIFCKHYLICKENFKQVSLLNETDIAVLRKLNIEKQDHGCDLVVEVKKGVYAAIQCKFTNDQEIKRLSWTGSNLSSFLAASTKADVRIIFTNASGVAPAVIKKAQESKVYSQYCFMHLNELSEKELQSIYRSILGKKVKAKYFIPRLHQKAAVNKVVSCFKNESKGKLILPCGAGKTLTALWIKEKIKPQKTLVLVPSLSLLRQFKNDWNSQGKTKSDFFSVCSEKDILGSDSPELNIFEIGGNVTTNPQEIRKILTSNKPLIIYSTYQSSPKIAEAMKGTKLKFDLVICDEAHRTSGEKSSAFATILDDKKILASKRLFMTATPRIVSETVKNKLGNEEYKYLADMNDKHLFGKEFFYMNFGDAIKRKPAFLSDYKIIAVGVTNEEVENWIKERRLTKDTSIDEIAHNYALEKVMKKYKANHAITFHSRVRSALAFKNRHEKMFSRIDSFHVSGSQSSSDRAHTLSKFKDAKSAVISNARCLTEGVDVPSIDMVYFCDPKNSKIDIVQATGRALRVNKGKKIGYIVVPLFHKTDSDTEKIIEDGNYKVLIQVVRAMADQDSRIEEEIKSLKYGLVKKNDNSKLDLEINNNSNARIELLDFEIKLRNSIYAEILNKSAIKWLSYEAARDFVRKLKLPGGKQWEEFSKSSERPSGIPSNPNQIYRNHGWQGMGDWLGTGTIANKDKSFLPFKEARAIVQQFKFKNSIEWKKYLVSPSRQIDIPSNPNQTYRNEGWKNLGDWLGTDLIAPRDRKYRSFFEARKFVHKLKLKRTEEWKEFIRSGKKPDDIPSAAMRIYKNQGWNGMGDWLGTGTIAPNDRAYLPFQKARAYVQKLKIKSRKEWVIYAKSKKKPDDIPASPSNSYKNSGWKGMGDWLGTGTIAPINKMYRPFKEARKFVQNLELKNTKAWFDYVKSKEKPDDIPSSPHISYKKHGWKNYGDWLGSKRISNWNKSFLSFKEARAFVRKLKLKNQKEWNEYSKSSFRKKVIPTSPKNTYLNKGWKGMGDWLGTGNTSAKNRVYRSFEEARKFVHKLKLKNSEEWGDYSKSGKKPLDIPAAPDKTYRIKGWKSMGDWLGTGTIAPQNREYLSFEKAREYVHKLKLKNREEWNRFSCSGKKPEDIPAGPNRTYKQQGWKGMGDWLGTVAIASQDRVYRPFEKAREYVHKLKLTNSKEWLEFSRSGKKPIDIPSYPDQTYKKKGWLNMADWLGNNK